MKKIIPIRIRVILLLCFFIGSLGILTYKAYMDKVNKESSDAVKIAVTISPLDFRIDSLGKISGLQYDLANLLLKDTTITWVPTTSRDEAMKKILAGDVDIYASSYPLTAQRHIEGVLPTRELYVSGFALVQRQDSIEGNHWKRRLQGEDKIKIYIPKEDKSARMMLENLRDFSCPAIEIVEADKSLETLCLEVRSGAIEYAFGDRNVVSKINDRIAGLDIVRDIAFDVYQVWLVNDKKKALLHQLNRSIIVHETAPEMTDVLVKYGLK